MICCVVSNCDAVDIPGASKNVHAFEPKYVQNFIRVAQLTTHVHGCNVCTTAFVHPSLCTNGLLLLFPRTEERNLAALSKTPTLLSPPRFSLKQPLSLDVSTRKASKGKPNQNTPPNPTQTNPTQHNLTKLNATQYERRKYSCVYTQPKTNTNQHNPTQPKTRGEKYS